MLKSGAFARRHRAKLRVAAAATAIAVMGTGLVAGGAGAATSGGYAGMSLNKTIATALGTSYPASKLPKYMTQALQVAGKPLTAAQLTKAFTCWKATTCTLGSGKLVLGIATANDVDTWRSTSKMGIILQALQYPQIGKYIFTNAQGNVSEYESDIRELVSEGANMIVAYNTFGKASWPAYEAAQRDGVPISTYVGPETTVPTSAITTSVEPTICAVGKTMAKITKQVVGSSPVAYFTGTPGNPEDAGWQKCATAAGVHSVFNANTTWTPTGAQKAASALIASGKPAKAILYSYSTPVPNIVSAYNQAGKKIPAIITWTTNNSTVCLLQKTAFTMYLTNALNWAGRVSLTTLLAKKEGKSVPAAIRYPQPFFKASASQCTPSAPGGYPGTSALIPNSLSQRMLATTSAS